MQRHAARRRAKRLRGRGGVPPLSIRVAARLRSLPYAMEKLFSRAGRHAQLNHFSSFTAAAPSGRVVAAELVRVVPSPMGTLSSHAGRHPQPRHF